MPRRLSVATSHRFATDLAAFDTDRRVRTAEIADCDLEVSDFAGMTRDLILQFARFGGRLSASFLCKACNDEMGRVESYLPRDITVLYLALCLGDRVAGDPSAAGALSTNRHSTATPSEPVHLLRAVTEDGATRVQFQIFRHLVWPVYFPNVDLEGEQTRYRAHVTTRSECWATKIA